MKGFGNEVEGPLPHALHCQIDGGESSYEHHCDGGVGLDRRRQHLQAVAVRHLLIGKNHVISRRRDEPQGLLYSRTFGDLMAVSLQVQRQYAARMRFVIYDQYSAHNFSMTCLHLCQGNRQGKAHTARFIHGENQVAAMSAGYVACNGKT